MNALRDLAYRWFVRFNPLYFFSALCVLVGVYLVSGELDTPGWESGRFGLIGILQVYEALLILASALLFRVARDPRPAVILGLLAVAFAFDPTYQLEVLTAMQSGSAVVAAVWIALTLCKVMGLVWAFRLRPDRGLLAIPMLGAAGLVAVPSLLVLRLADAQIVHVLAVWYFAAVVAATLLIRPTVACAVPLDDWGRMVLHRAVRGALGVWAGLGVSHLWSWAHLYDISLSPLHLAPLFLLFPFFVRHEGSVWFGSAMAILVSVSHPQTVTPTAIAATAVLAWFGWHTDRKRLWGGAILAIYAACWTAGWEQGPLGEPPWWLVVEAGLALLALAWSMRLPSAAVEALMLWTFAVVRHGRALGTLGWGVLLLALGFVSLAAGVSFNWRRRAGLKP